ncbi:MAG: efflux RND transporter permease subunit, partial [Bacteriovoracaceae bacterium]|nr:efflux RND transporter permease subunit [Bacteriovoracaceae bacterium]
MIEFFVRHPVTTAMFIIFFVVLGIVSYTSLPIESTPKTDFPVVSVKVVYPGASPEEVESQIIKKIEDVVSEISAVKTITARAYESLAMVMIEFELEEDINVKSIEVKDKVEAIINDFPSSAERPTIEKFDPLSTAVVSLYLTSDTLDGRTLYEYADKVLKNKFTMVEDVASVDIYGGRERQINVLLDPNLMKKYYISISEITQAVAATNTNIPGGTIDQAVEGLTVRFTGEFTKLDDVLSMNIIASDGTKVKLGQIAKTVDTFKKIEKIGRFNGRDSVGIDLIQSSDGNSIKVSKSVKKLFPEWLKELPPHMQLDIGSDATTHITRNTNETINNIIIGIILTILILYLFTGQFKLTVISSVVIPTSVISTFFLVQKAGFTINMMTLMAIGTCLGTLIANAIVIIENILVHINNGEPPIEASVAGTKEVTVAVLGSAGTNVVVFTPIAFMGGLAGKFMMQFGLTVVFATCFSLIASFSLTPMLCALVLNRRRRKSTTAATMINPVEQAAKEKAPNFVIKSINRMLNFLIQEYKVIFDWAFRHPGWVIIISLIAFLGPFTLFPYLGSEFNPSSDQDKIKINLTAPQGSTIEYTSSMATQIEEIVRQDPDVVSYNTYVGNNGTENARIMANLKPVAQRTRSDTQIMNELIPALSLIPDAELEIARGGAIGGMGGDLTINLRGPNDKYDQMIETANKMVQIMHETGNFRSISSSYKGPKKEVRFVPDQRKMSFYNIKNATIGGLLRASIYGDDSNYFKEKGEEYKINITLGEIFNKTIQNVRDIHTIARKGLIPLSALGDIQEVKSIPTIMREDRSRVITINGYLAKSSAGQVQRVVNPEFDKLMGNGISYTYGGMNRHMKETTAEIQKAFILAAILTYMLLAALMNSFIHPISIATCIFTSMAGSVFFMFYMGSSVNVSSMLSLVMLVGLVVNNAILLLDQTIQNLHKEMPIKEALWQAASLKFRPILMTSIAIIAGTAPQLGAVEVAKSTMSAVLIGGVGASIFFALFTVPLVFYALESMRRWFLGL